MASTPQITDRARAYHERMFPGYVSAFLRTDPEFIERFDNFAFDEVVNEAAGGSDLPERTRFIAILAVLAGSQAVEEFGAMVPAALNFGVSPTDVKELVYQASAYLGIGRAFPFLNARDPQQRGYRGAGRDLRRAHARLSRERHRSGCAHQPLAHRPLLR